eukprot:CAMPEP_0202956042 /NCGR_PEP_ID=MMETSP1396-20130829/600_1 /ASSEMBLY_ACC=CAM_ASM_000872 /TAXON_ID= /ORGANISM="Pseudokeronopsis sp., Strain Brazil" /LENGTH=96 /DNA_ID=CAMNT_0049672889 /DNA_START=35 /DNA_END=325 /DNA_ORIENTATION=+
MEKEPYEVKTVAPDRVHYPAVNQAHFCWQKYNEFVICLKKNNGDASECGNQRLAYRHICPHEWTDSWDEQRAAGTFLGVQEKEVEAPHHGHGHGHH